jgi:hypothetical protein
LSGYRRGDSFKGSAAACVSTVRFDPTWIKPVSAPLAFRNFS